MTAGHDVVAPFEPDNDEWTKYIECLQFYFTVNNSRDGPKQKAILLSNCDASTFRLLKSIVLPDALVEITFAVLVEKMKNTTNPSLL